MAAGVLFKEEEIEPGENILKSTSKTRVSHCASSGGSREREHRDVGMVGSTAFPSGLLFRKLYSEFLCVAFVCPLNPHPPVLVVEDSRIILQATFSKQTQCSWPLLISVHFNILVASTGLTPIYPQPSLSTAYFFYMSRAEIVVLLISEPGSHVARLGLEMKGFSESLPLIAAP